MPWLAPMLTASTFPKPLVQELEVDLFVVIRLWACATTRMMYRCCTGQLPAHGLEPLLCPSVVSCRVMRLSTPLMSQT